MLQRPCVYANQSLSGTPQLSPSLSGFSSDTDFPHLLPPLCPHSCHHHKFSLWFSYLQAHRLPATSTQPPKSSLQRKSDHVAPVLNTCLWLPPVHKIISNLTPNPSAWHSEPFPIGPCAPIPAHQSSHYAPAPPNLSRPANTPPSFSSPPWRARLQFCPIPTPTCHSGLNLGFTTSRSQIALL